MAGRYFNWKLLVVLVLATSMLVVTAIGLRKWQKGQKSGIAFEAGNKAFDEQKWDEAASNIGRYISSNPQDIEMIDKYATSQLNRRPRGRDNINQAINAYRMIRQVDKSNVDATQKLAELYIQMRIPGEAELILKDCPGLDSSADLSKLLALSMAAQKKYEDAVKQINKVIQAYPDNVSAYAVLAQLSAMQPEIVSQPMEYWYDKAVEENPSSPKAYILRANYRLRKRDEQGFNSDLEKVMELGITDSGEKLNIAKLLYLTNKLVEAEKLLEDIAAQDPQNVSLWMLWVDLAKRSGSRDKILKIVRDAQKAMEQDPWDFMATAAEIFIQYNQIDDAKKCVSRLKAKKMDPLVVARLEAMLIDLDGDPFKAIEAWREVIALAGRSSGTAFPEKSVRMALAMAYFRANDSAAGVRELTELLEEYPSYWQAYMVLARDAFKNGNSLQTSEYAGKVLQIVPGYTEAKSLYIQARIQLLSQKNAAGDPSDLADIELQIAELEKIPSMALQAGLLKFRVAAGKSEFETAGKILEKLKADFPEDIRVVMAGADLYAAQNKTDETIVYLTQAIEDHPAASEPVLFLASILARKNEQEKCIELVKGSISRNEDMRLSYFLADIYLNWNRQEELYDFLAGLSVDNPNDIEVKTRLLSTKVIMDDPAKGQKVVDEIKAIAGENSWQWRYHQSRLWSLAEDFQAHYSEIVPLLKRNLLENPTDQASRLLLANAYFKAGDVQLAFSIFREAFDRSPDDLGVILPMVSALYRAKEFAMADEILSKVSAKTMGNPQLSRLKIDSHIRQGDYSVASELLRNSLTGSSSTESDKLTLAILEMEQKNYSEAAKLLEELKSTVTEPGLLQSIVARQIQLNVQQNNPQEAIKICDKQVENNSDAASLILRARTYFSIGENEKASADFNSAIEKEPESTDAWVARSRFYASTGQIQKAIDDFGKALSLDETDVQLQRQMVQLMLSSGIQDAVNGGRDLLAKSLADNPDDVGLMMIKARLLYQKRTVPSRNESALVLERIIRKVPLNVEAWNMLGQIALDRLQYDKAIDYAQRGLSLKPDDRGLMLLKARAESGRSPAFAIPTLVTLYELDPGNVENAIFLAETYSKSGQTKKAVALLESQLAKTEDEQDASMCRLALAQALYRNGQQAEAEKIFAVSMESETRSLTTLAIYTNLLSESMQFDKCFKQITGWVEANPDKSLNVISVVERLVNSNAGNPTVTSLAIKALEKVSEVNPDAPESLQSMAVMYQMTGQDDKAVAMYERILDRKPDDVIVLNNLAWAYSQRDGMYPKALEMADKGLEIAPDYIDLIDTRGFIHTKMGQYEDGIADFKRCLELYPATNPAIISTRLHLAKAYKLAGQNDLAIKELNTIVANKLKLSNRVRDMKRADLAEAVGLLNTLSKVEGNNAENNEKKS